MRILAQLILLLVAVLLAGCVSRAQRDANWMTEARQTCLSAGFRSDDPALSQCTLQVYQQNKATRDEASQALMLQGLQTLSQRPPLPQAPTTCTSFVRGQWIQTTCQ